MELRVIGRYGLDVGEGEMEYHPCARAGCVPEVQEQEQQQEQGEQFVSEEQLRTVA